MLILLTVVVFPAYTLRTLVASDKLVTHTLLVLRMLNETRTLLIDAETGQRGYIITGAESSLEPHRRALSLTSGVDRHVHDLQALTTDNPAQQRRLDSLDMLVSHKLAEMQTTIDLRRVSGLQAARFVVMTNRGKALMDDIRGIIHEAEAEETLLLTRRTASADASLRNTVIVMVLGTVVSVLLIALALYLVGQEAAARRRAADELSHVNRELDNRVGELAASNLQIEQQFDRLKSLNAIDQAILGATDLRLTLKTVMEEVTARLGVDGVAVFVFNSETLMLEMNAVSGNRATDTERLSIRLGDGISGRAALERRTLAVSDVTEFDLSPALRRVAAVEGIRAVYATPLIAKGELVGVLSVTFRTGFVADAGWLRFFEALAAQTSMAVNSGRVTEDLQRSNLSLRLAYDNTIEGWSRALDLRDNETEGHTQRVTEMTVSLARMAGMTESEIVQVRRGALLHDIGKMGVPDAILRKGGPLSDEEWVVMRQHPQHAYDLLKPIEFLRPALDIPYCHHERWDGTGYPNGLKGDRIPVAARRFAVVDVWDALSSDRPYRKGWPQSQVLEHLKALRGTHLDPAAVDAFLELLGSRVPALV